MKKTISRKDFKQVKLDDAVKKHKPFTNAETDRLVKRLNTFYSKLRKDFGGERFDLYTATIISIAAPTGLITNIRGNMLAAQFAIANAISIIVESVVESMKMTRENVLLYCITDLAKEVRQIWEKQHTPPTNAPQKVTIYSEG